MSSLDSVVKATSATVSRITDRMESTLERMGATPCGVDWCIAAIDPFHDTALRDLDGFPDATTMKSVVEVVTSAQTISCPSAITTGTWECKLVNWNWHQQVGLYNAFLSGNTISNPSSPSVSITGGNLQVWAQALGNTEMNTGGLTYSTGISGYTEGTSGVLTSGSICPDAAFVSGTYRVIGQAFEVYSIGPALYRSGISYLWRLPSPDASLSPVAKFISATNVAATIPPYAKAYVFDQIPLNISDAELIPDTVMLNAEEGCYVVSRYNSEDTTAGNDPLVCPVMRLGQSTFSDNNLNVANFAYAPGITFNGLVAGAQSWIVQQTVPSAQVANFDISGAMFTGLNPQDSLEIRVRWIIEKFPTMDEKVILTLATPSPKRDDVAIEAYSEISQVLPVGVPVRANSLGDWFKEAAGALTKFATPILKSIPHPAAQNLALISGGASKLLNGSQKQEKTSKKMSSGPNPDKKTQVQKKAIMPNNGKLMKKK